MSIYKDGKLIAGGRQCMPLLSFMWADHILNDVSWLRADTYSWQSGAVYQAAYQHLEDDIDGKTLQSETIAGITIQFYLADDGHKIVLADQESNVTAIYAATGVAWYYILDTVNQRFKLPRTQFAFTGIRNGVGGFVEAGLPNITGVISASHTQYTTDEISGCFYTKEQQSVALDGGGRGTVHRTIGFDSSRSSSIYGNSDTVQPKATEMYLYFYVGNFTQTALENTAGLNAELFNGKANLNLSNVLANIDFVVESQEPTAGNGYTWYRKYRSGWVEQGGRTTTSNQTITFPIPFADVPNMTWGLCTTRNNAASYDREIFFGSITATNFISGSRLNEAVSPGYMWHAVGIAAN